MNDVKGVFYITKVIVVDDEKGIVEGLKYIIERHMPECEVVGTAYNGIEGFQIVLELEPDIVITDIRMPQEDGLEMIRRLKVEGSNARFIILSGYSEFEYAKKGMELGVKFYISKPVEEEELYKCMQKVISEIKSEGEEKKEIENLKNKVQSSRKSLKEFVLRDIIDAGSENTDDIRYLLESIGFPAKNKYYVCAVVDVDCELAGMDEIQEEVYEKITSCLGMLTGVYAFKYVELQIAVIVSDHKEINETKLYHDMMRAREVVSDYMKAQVSVGIGLVNSNVSGISKSFEEAQHALRYKIIKGANTVISYKEIEKIPGNRMLVSEQDISSIEACIENNDFKGISRIIEDIFGEVALKKDLSLSDLQVQCLCILLSGIRRMPPLQVQLNEFLGKNILSLEGISRFKTLEQLQNWLLNTIRSIMELKTTSNLPTKKDVISEIKEYIADNFDKNISLSDLSSRFFINPYYLSQLFKKRTGDTFLNHVMKLRINKAKKLLEETDLKVYEICEMVGYSDTNHFGRIFEKFAGCKPGQYKKKTEVSEL